MILADSNGGLEALATKSNDFQGYYNYLNRQWDYLQIYFENGKLKSSSIYEILDIGRFGNENATLHDFAKAESYYRKTLGQ